MYMPEGSETTEPAQASLLPWTPELLGDGEQKVCLHQRPARATAYLIPQPAHMVRARRPRGFPDEEFLTIQCGAARLGKADGRRRNHERARTAACQSGLDERRGR